MRPRDARLVLTQIQSWEAEGLVTTTQAEALRGRYEGLAARTDTPAGAHAGVVVLQALGGVVLGAAVIAFAVFLGFESATAAWVLAVAGLALLASGVAAALRGFELGDALLAAGLVPLTFAASEADQNALLFALPILGPLVAVAFRLEARYVPLLVAVAFATATGIAFLQVGWEPVVWFVLLIIATAASVASPQLRAKDAWHAATATLVVAVAVAAAITYFDLEMDWATGGVELFIGLLMIAGLAGGILLRHRGLILGAAIVLAVDAIVFAFDVGGLIGGTLTLFLVAGALLWFGMTKAKEFMK